MKQTPKKKGFFFSLDALLAIALLLSALLLTNAISTPQEQVDQTSQKAQDLARALSTISVQEIEDEWVQERIANGTIADPSVSVIHQLGKFWALDEQNNAETLANILLEEIPGFTIEVLISGTQYYLQEGSEQNVASARRMISGVTQGEALEGSTGVAFLQKITNKEQLSTTYFGGFTGQGNITQQLILEEDYTPSDLLSLTLRLETPGVFDVIINDALCSSSLTGTLGVVSDWDLTSCSALLQPNKNNVSLAFTSHINNSYISGGYLQAHYLTDELISPSTPGTTRYYFPEIEGFINLFDSIRAQGTIDELFVNITFESEYDTFLRIGNQTIFFLTGESGVRTINLTRIVSSNDSQLPLRLGLANVSGSGIIPGAPVDTALVTDSSGSMNTCGLFEENTTTMCAYQYCSVSFWGFCVAWSDISCEHTGVCSGNVCSSPSSNTRNHEVTEEYLCEATFMELAQDAAELFVDRILDASTQHRIGLVDYGTNVKSTLDLTNDQAALSSEINSYSPNGWTCTCCGLNYARMLIEDTDNQHSIVLLSDGQANYVCDDVYSTTSNSGASPDIPLATQNAIDSGAYACGKGIDVYTIGMGDEITPEWEEDLKDIACNETMYFDATSVEDLAEIYELISGQILQTANYTGQSVEIVGSFNTTRVFPNSYVDISYTPFENIDTQGKLSLFFEEEIFTSSPHCEGSVFIPERVQVRDALITSFSGNNWTKELTVSNFLGTNTVYNLSTFSDQYRAVGDPFQIQIPSQVLVPGETNTITLSVGESPINTSATCNLANSIVYEALLNMSVSRGLIKPQAQGCEWTIEFADSSTTTILVPEDYAGTKTCSYTSTEITYDEDDSYDEAVFRLLQQLDLFDDGTVYVNLDEEALQVVVSIVSDVPYLWGPVTSQVVVSR